jgi:hypothetical protein
VPTTLPDVWRVLKPGGTVWGTLAAAPEAAARLLSSLLVLRFGDVAYVSYSFLNGLLTIMADKQLRWINRKKCESVNTCGSIRRLLGSSGFKNIVVDYYDRKIIFSAQRPL